MENLGFFASVLNSLQSVRGVGPKNRIFTLFQCFCNAAVSCFGGFFSCAEASSVLYHNFCIYHVDAPGHEVSTLFHQMLLAPATLLLQGMVVSLECIMSQNERQQASGLRQIDMCKQSRSLPSDSGVQTGIAISVALHIY